MLFIRFVPVFSKLPLVYVPIQKIFFRFLFDTFRLQCYIYIHIGKNYV